MTATLRQTLFLGLLGPLLAAPLAARADANYTTLQAVLTGYNVYVQGNFGTASNPYSSDAQGAVAVGGNAWLQNFQAGGSQPAGSVSLTVGGNLSMQSASSTGSVAVGGNATLSSTAIGTSLKANSQALTVDGSLTAQNGTISGNTTVGGTANFPNSGSGLTVQGNLNVDGGKPANLPTSVTGTSVYGTGAAKPATVSNIASSFSYLDTASAELDTTLQSLGTLGTASNSYGQLDLTGTGSVNFFDITASQLVGINGLDFITPTNSVNIINVTGQLSGTLSGFGFLGNVNSATTLFNFTSATLLSLNGIGFQGSILAPYAEVEAINGNFNGSVIAASFGSQLNSDAQFNQSAFVGIPGAAAYTGVPEPGSLALLLAATLFIVWLRRRPA